MPYQPSGLGNLRDVPRIRAASIAEHKVITRILILDTARELFSTWGYQDTSFGDIASAVGMGRTTLYDYFSDKDDLLASLVEETLPSVIKSLVERVPESLPPTERLRRLAIHSMEFLVAEPTLGHILHREVPKLSESAQQRVANAHQALGRAIVDAYRAGVDQQYFKELPPGLAGRFINSIIMSGAQALIDSDDPSQSLPAITDAMVDLIFDGLATRPIASIDQSIRPATLEFGGKRP